jgi:DNA-binding MarR family transcriptional regulator
MPKTAVRKARRTRNPARTYADVPEQHTKRSPPAKAVAGNLQSESKKGSLARAAKSKRTPKKRKKKAAAHTAGESAARVPVNEIVEQWQRERPDLDPAPMRLFGVLAQAHLLTTPYINRVIAKHGLVRGTFDVLSALRRAGSPFSLTPKQLAESLMLSGAGMTSRLDRLESLHLVARLPEPNDRRSLKIQLTQKGVKLIDEVIPQIVDAQWQLVSSLGSTDTATLIDLLRRLTDTLFASIDPRDLH